MALAPNLGSFASYAALIAKFPAGSVQAGAIAFTQDYGTVVSNGVSYDLVVRPVIPPIGFRWTAPPVNIGRTTAGFITDFNVTTLIPAVTKTYYVNPLTGNDTNAGTSGSPLQHLATALAKSDVDQIIIAGLTADYVAFGNFGWNNTQPSRSLSVLNRTGFRYISLRAAAVPTWTVNGTYANVYQTPSTLTNSKSVVDLLTSSTPSYVDQSGATVSISLVPKRFRTLVQVTTLAAVNATAGTWFNDATNTYVRSFEDRNLLGDQNMFCCDTTNNFRFPTAVNNCTIYVESIDFVGGRSYIGMASTVTGCVAAFNSCSFQASSVPDNYNGLNTVANATVYTVNCGVYDNGADGFNYHSNESDGTTAGTSPNFLEIGNCAIGNGLTGSSGSSDNASTCHDFCNGIRLNGAYINTADRTLADVNYSRTWNLGCFVGPSQITGTGGESICAENNAKVWIDSCYTPAGTFPRWGAINSANLYYHNSGSVTNSAGSTGTVAPYIPGSQSVATWQPGYVSASLASGSAVSLTTTTSANVASISLPPGDWDVTGVVDYTPGGTTSITQLTQGISTSSAVLGAQDTYSQDVTAAQVPGATQIAKVVPTVRLDLRDYVANTTVYLVTNAAFTVSTLGAYGTLRARRVG